MHATAGASGRGRARNRARGESDDDMGNSPREPCIPARRESVEETTRRMPAHGAGARRSHGCRTAQGATLVDHARHLPRRGHRSRARRARVRSAGRSPGLALRIARLPAADERGSGTWSGPREGLTVAGAAAEFARMHSRAAPRSRFTRREEAAADTCWRRCYRIGPRGVDAWRRSSAPHRCQTLPNAGAGASGGQRMLYVASCGRRTSLPARQWPACRAPTRGRDRRSSEEHPT